MLVRPQIIKAARNCVKSFNTKTPNGPDLRFASWSSAAAQLPRSRHSCSAQHFVGGNVGVRGFAAVRCECKILGFASPASERSAGMRHSLLSLKTSIKMPKAVVD